MKGSVFTLCVLFGLAMPAISVGKKAPDSETTVAAKKLKTTDIDLRPDSEVRLYDSSAEAKLTKNSRNQDDPRIPQSMPEMQSGQATANPPTIPIFK